MNVGAPEAVWALDACPWPGSRPTEKVSLLPRFGGLHDAAFATDINDWHVGNVHRDAEPLKKESKRTLRVIPDCRRDIARGRARLNRSGDVRFGLVEKIDSRDHQRRTDKPQREDKDSPARSGRLGPVHPPSNLHNPLTTSCDTSLRLATATALYLRVSSEEQDLAGQERDLRAEVERREWTVVAVYTEKVTGTGRVERDEYERLRGDSRRPDRPFDRVLVWSLDRWSRDPSFVRAVGSIEELEALGLRFHSLREPTLDSAEDGSPSIARDLLRAVLPVISSFESRRKSERTRVAMREILAGRRKTRSGRPVGRPRRVTPELMGKIGELRRSGLPWKDVARRVGLPAETCRKASWLLKRAGLAVDNPPASQTVPVPPEEPLR